MLVRHGRYTALIGGAIFMLPGCATMPPEVVTYYLPKAKTKIVITQSLACDAAGKRLVSDSVVSAETAYSADESRPLTIAFNDFGGTFADADVAFGFTEDGRLSSINAAITGQGAEVVKQAVALATAVGGAAVAFADPAAIKSACAAIKTLGGMAGAKDATVGTITYAATLRYAKDGTLIAADPGDNPGYAKADPAAAVALRPDARSRALHAQMARFSEALVSFTATVEKSEAMTPRVAWQGWSAKTNPAAPSHYVKLLMNDTKRVALHVDGPKPDFSDSEAIWHDYVVVPADSVYPLLVPTGMLFGSQHLVVEIAPSGQITKIQYATNTGASAVLGVAGSVGGALPTDASIAKADSSASDRIYEGQRRALCQADPKSCPK